MAVRERVGHERRDAALGANAARTEAIRTTYDPDGLLEAAARLP